MSVLSEKNSFLIYKSQQNNKKWLPRIVGSHFLLILTLLDATIRTIIHLSNEN